MISLVGISSLNFPFSVRTPMIIVLFLLNTSHSVLVCCTLLFQTFPPASVVFYMFPVSWNLSIFSTAVVTVIVTSIVFISHTKHFISFISDCSYLISPFVLSCAMLTAVSSFL